VVVCRDLGGTSVELLRLRRSREVPLGTVTLDDAGQRSAAAILTAHRPQAVLLRLPPGAVLERQVALPLAAEQGFERLAEYEMDRFTPFTAAEVFWSAEVLHRDRAQQRLSLLITLAPKAVLAPLLHRLARLGVRPTDIEGRGSSGALRRIVLARPNQRRQRRMVAFAAGTCAVLAAACIAVPFLRQSQARARVELEIAALQPRVAEVDALHRSLESASAGNDVIGGEHARLGDALAAVATLTELLPDDTFLTALSLRQRQLTIDGESAGAARLIGVLSADPSIRNASFAAPVTRSQGGTDVFSIRAELKP
jgi:general secretion pathway protein L